MTPRQRYRIKRRKKICKKEKARHVVLGVLDRVKTGLDAGALNDAKAFEMLCAAISQVTGHRQLAASVAAGH